MRLVDPAHAQHALDDTFVDPPGATDAIDPRRGAPGRPVYLFVGWA